MHARALDDAKPGSSSSTTTSSRTSVWAASALSASLAATALYPPLVMPLFVGGITMGVARHPRASGGIGISSTDSPTTAMRTPFAEVREYAAREARMARRAHFAELAPQLGSAASTSSIAEITDELDELAHELEDAALELDPACRDSACRRFLTEPAASPLFGEVHGPTTFGPASHGSAPASGLARSCFPHTGESRLSAALSVCPLSVERAS